MYAKFIKRPLDLIFALLLTVLLLPLMAMLLLAVRISLGKHVIFRQERPGKDEKVFCLYKIRTMTDARDDTGALLPDGERMTALGRFMRSFSLDELPQLINIIRGDMSFIGPRPLLCEYLPLYNEAQRHRHDVRPGLTGLAQVMGRNSLSWEEKFALDTKYAENVTFFGDFKIVLLTFAAVFGRKGVNSEGSASAEPFTGNKDE